MDAVEIISAISGSAVLLVMFGMAARRSWLDRQEAKRETEHRIGVAVA